MGVVDRNGVVGIVSNVGPNSARVISLLNPHFRLCANSRRTDYFGSLVWDSVNPDVAMLEELPRHTVFAPGDTIVTSGYSAVFPGPADGYSDLTTIETIIRIFFTLRVKLLTDFTTLSNVQVVVNNNRRTKINSGGEENDSRKTPSETLD